MWTKTSSEPIIMPNIIDPNERYFYFIDNNFIRNCYVKYDKNILKIYPTK